MRIAHYEQFKPFCPVCSVAQPRAMLSLRIDSTVNGHVISGLLGCRNPHCLCEFPILDGLPILVPDPVAYINSQYQTLVRRADLSALINDAIIECQGPGAWDDATRQHISGSAWDHWSEFDPREQSDESPGAIAAIVDRAHSLYPHEHADSAIDVGCALGRSTFELARVSKGLVLGVDIHAGMIQKAASILQSGRLSYQRRSCGMLYDLREFEVPISDCAERVDFWIMNAGQPCIESEKMDCVNMLNVVDCTPAPIELIRSAAALVARGGVMIIATPFDWNPSVTPVHAWIGGHSPRGFFHGKSEEILRSILTPGSHPVSIEGFSIVAEERDLPWHVRIHDRAIMKYNLHMLIAKRNE